jgi:hypothetical protein
VPGSWLHVRELRLDRGNGIVRICKCGKWNGQGCNYGLKENVVGCDSKSVLDANAGNSCPGTDRKYPGFCIVVWLAVLMACRGSATTFDRFHSDYPPIWDLGAFGCSNSRALRLLAYSFALLSCGYDFGGVFPSSFGYRFKNLGECRHLTCCNQFLSMASKF